MTMYDRIDENKVAIDTIRPFEGEMLRQIRDYYRIGLTWTSNAIEGNSLTEIETKVLLEDGLTVGGRPLRDTLEAIGHSNAYGYMLAVVPPVLRADYLSAIRRYQQSEDAVPFCDFIAERVLESEKEIMRLLKIRA